MNNADVLDYLLMAPVARMCMLASSRLLGMCFNNTKHILLFNHVFSLPGFTS